LRVESYAKLECAASKVIYLIPNTSFLIPDIGGGEPQLQNKRGTILFLEVGERNAEYNKKYNN